MIRAGERVDGRYEVIRLLGEGGIAQVWLVRHIELGSLHALKMLVWRKPKLAERLLLEGRIQAQLRHPNVVSVTDVVRHDGQAGLLMEYVDGQSLQTYLVEHGGLGVDRGLEMFAQILAGVTAAHDAGVLHRDLKPANILLANTPSGLLPKVTDFGLAKVVIEEGRTDGTRVGAVMGTPGYMAPEQARDSATVTARADVFALGAILFELVSGRKTFPDDASFDEAVHKGVVPDLDDLLPSCPRSVSDAVTRALAIDARERFPDCRSFGRAVLTGRPDLLAMVGGQRPSTPLALPRQLPDTGRAAQPTILPPVLPEGAGPEAPTLRGPDAPEASAYTIQVGDEGQEARVAAGGGPMRAVAILLVVCGAVAGGLAVGWAGSRILDGDFSIPQFANPAADGEKPAGKQREDSGGPGPGGRARKGRPVNAEAEGTMGALPASGDLPSSIPTHWVGHAGQRKVALRFEDTSVESVRVVATGFLAEAQDLEGGMESGGRFAVASDRIELRGTFTGGRAFGTWRKAGQDAWFSWEARPK